MTSKPEINIVNRLKNILKELREHIKSPQEKHLILEKRIQERLNKSLETYYSQLTGVFDRLSIYDNEHDLKLIKRLNKE
jgi:DNA mismatch repair ATPase MutS